ncbi:MAG: MobA/MobL family protein [Faecalibacterium sp.]|jgi:hypothetical protein|nr:MobA/MobL family protein [Faecalibacterium sp.]
MAIYHLEAKVVSRGAGRSAVAAAAYMSCSRLYNDYDGIQHDYTRKHGLCWQQVFLPPQALTFWHDREVLWNAVEAAETAKDSRLAREFVAALPTGLNLACWRELLSQFVQEQFVAEGMCADVCIHDTDGHNPHAHILLTVRPLNPDGSWQRKTEKEYLCIRSGEERGFTTAEFRIAQATGWEKQYQYQVGKKHCYMAANASAQHGYKRLSKYPKSTKYGRQNPISARWNSEEQLLAWRQAWADTVNLHLERAGSAERIDHRSFAAQGIDEQPTVHEGVAAAAMELHSTTSDRRKINRQIRADNQLLCRIKQEVARLAKALEATVPALAEAMETLRQKLLILSYQLCHIYATASELHQALNCVQPKLLRYDEINRSLQDLRQKKQFLQAEKAALPIYRVPQQIALSQQLATLTEDSEELQSEKHALLSDFPQMDADGVKAVRQRVTAWETSLQKLKRTEKNTVTERGTVLTEYNTKKVQAATLDGRELFTARKALRHTLTAQAEQQLQDTYDKAYNRNFLTEAKRNVSDLTGGVQDLFVGTTTKQTSSEKQKELSRNNFPDKLEETPER